MNAYVSKEEIALQLPTSLSHYFKDDVSFVAPAPRQGNRLISALRAVVTWIIEAPQRQATITELSSLTDHELADIGLARSEVPMVFDADFRTSRFGNN